MKKLYMFLGLALTAPAFGQQHAPGQVAPERQHRLDNGVAVPFHEHAVQTRANTVSKWMNFGRLMQFVDSANTPHYFTYLFPDSIVRVEGDTDWGWAGTHALGQVFDPTAPSWEYYGDPELPITQWMPYTVDSVSIPYAYFRFQHANPDTLFMQYYKSTPPSSGGITLIPDAFGGGEPVGLVVYDSVALVGKKAFSSVKRLLTDEDTAMAFRRYLDFAVGANMNAGQKFAFTNIYRPGNPYSFGDTLEVFSTTVDSIYNPINAFIEYEYGDQNKTMDAGHYNHELTIPTSVRYSIDAQGWDGFFIPGLAYNNAYFHMDAYILISYDADALSAATLNPVAHMQLYPNPATDNMQLIGNMNGDCKVAVENTLGQTVVSYNESLHSGVPSYINVSGLASGTYMLTVTNKGGKATVRFVKD